MHIKHQETLYFQSGAKKKIIIDPANRYSQNTAKNKLNAGYGGIKPQSEINLKFLPSCQELFPEW